MVFMSVIGMGDGGGVLSGYLEKFYEEYVGCNLKYIFICIYMKVSFMQLKDLYSLKIFINV